MGGTPNTTSLTSSGFTSVLSLDDVIPAQTGRKYPTRDNPRYGAFSADGSRYAEPA